MTQQTISILLIEDNEGDIVLTQEAMRDAKLANNLLLARDGDEALDILYKRNGYEGAATPDLILLDLNLPVTDGYEVLEIMKQDEDLLRIPVVVLTSSESDADRIKTYQLHANCFVSKPLKASSFIEVVKTIENFWLSIVSLPPKAAAE
ncbi:response regulator [Donghicola sp. C2-DW-16]|uniref:Response regulator n=1 Tax=Donghicola mangrovi TaxID=2729614 RepID=A0ABX2PLZ7_9RHOB|nr:response regulator [Donghicola mangrovi]NVO29524.1 response regulator [Donghicola mangrovi]